MSLSNTLIFHGSRVLLPDHGELVEAFVVVDADKGTILSVNEGSLDQNQNEIGDNAQIIDAGGNVIIPGLVEYVPGKILSSSLPRLTNGLLAQSKKVRMCT